MAAQPFVRNTGSQLIRPACTVLQGQIELPHIMCRKSSLSIIFPIDIICRRTRPRGICRREGCVNLSLISCTPRLHIADDGQISVLAFVEEDIALDRIDRPIVLTVRRILGCDDTTAADGEFAVIVSTTLRIQGNPLVFYLF